MSFYLQYMSKWPDYFLTQEDPNGTIMGYSTCDLVSAMSGCITDELLFVVRSSHGQG